MLAEMDYLASECGRQSANKCFEAVPGQTCAGRLNRTDDGSVIISPLVALARAFNLQLHAYTFRNEVCTILLALRWLECIRRLCLWRWTFWLILPQNWNSIQTLVKELAWMRSSSIVQRRLCMSFVHNHSRQNLFQLNPATASRTIPPGAPSLAVSPQYTLVSVSGLRSLHCWLWLSWSLSLPSFATRVVPGTSRVSSSWSLPQTLNKMDPQQNSLV